MTEISETEIKSMTKEENYMHGYRDGKSDVLDKMRVDVEKKIIKRPWLNFEDRERDRNDAFLEVLDIIDKYKAESGE